MEKIQRTIEIERVVNLVKGFGWALDNTTQDEKELRITIKKDVTEPMPVG